MSRLISDSYMYRAIGAEINGACGKCSLSRSDCMGQSLSRMDVCGIIDDAPTVDAVPKTELFELFDRITTAWNGKQRFFPQDDGTIYDRNKCDYMKSLDDAVNRFCEELMV